MTNTIILVGDKFETFAQNDGVTTPLALAAAIEDGQVSDCIVVRGQGVSDSWISHIQDLAARSDLRVTLQGISDDIRRASCRSCHKIKRQNILISEPKPLRDNVFGSHLLIDEDCELMGDHQTGHHLQGMLLVEAARQMFLAVIERHLRPGRKNYAVINHMNAGFQNFAFPVATDIELKVSGRREDRPDRAAFDVTVIFLQAGAPVTTVETRFTTFDAEALQPKEANLARDRARFFVVPSEMPATLAVAS